MARLPDDHGDWGGGEASAESLGMVIVALALAVPRRPPRVCFHGAAMRERRPRNIRASPPRPRSRLFHRLGPPLGFLHLRKFHRFRLYRHSIGSRDPLHPIRTAVVSVRVASAGVTRHFVLHRLARRVSLPRPARSEE